MIYFLRMSAEKEKKKNLKFMSDFSSIKVIVASGKRQNFVKRATNKGKDKSGAGSDAGGSKKQNKKKTKLKVRLEEEMKKIWRKRGARSKETRGPKTRIIFQKRN